MKLTQAQFGIENTSPVNFDFDAQAVDLTTVYVLAGVIVPIVFLSVVSYFATKWLKRFMRSHARRHGTSFETMVLLVTVPKIRSEEESRPKSLQEIQEKISSVEKFFSAIGGMRAQKGYKANFIGRTDEISFEIVATDKLIKFYIVVSKNLRDFIEQQILSQYPDAHIEPVVDYNIFSPTGVIVASNLKLKRESAFPIKTYKKSEADPLNPIINALSKVDEEEGAAIQIIVRSAPSAWRKYGVKIARNMQQGMKLDDAIRGKKKESVLKALFVGGKKDEVKPPDQYRLSPQEEEMVRGLDEKASKAGLEVNIRVVVSAKNENSAQSILNNITGSFSQFNIYQFGNSFVVDTPKSKKEILNDFIYRVFDERSNIVLNTEEAASVWHLPGSGTETPNVLWLSARRAPAPSNTPTDGLHLGANLYRGKKKDVYIKVPDRQRHMYIIGKSGSGKSEFIRHMAGQDIKAGHGVCVLDPHGDLATSILGEIPKSRIDDVIVFSPWDLERPMGLNMLEARESHLKDFAVQEMISIFYKLFTAEMIGPIFEHQMRNVMLTLMADPDDPGTIAEIPRMFSDEEFAKKYVARLTDPVVRAFWEKEMAKTSDFHKSESLGYLISKVGRFVENEMMRNIIGQQKSSFDFRDVMDNKKILIVDLSKGKTGEINSKLLGLIIVSKLQMAALGRADMDEKDRKDFYLYIDEFQNFVTDSIATILSEARKYRLDLILAHQYMGQLVQGNDTNIRDAVLGNVGTMFVSRIGPEDAQMLEKEFTPVFTPYDLINSDKFTWTTKMIIDNTAQKPFTLSTFDPNLKKPDLKLADALRQISRLKYGRDKAIVEAEILERTQLGGSSVEMKTEASL